MLKTNDPRYPHPASIAVTKSMKANKRKNTKPEIAIRSLLHRRGLRFKKDVFIKINDKNCRPDIVFKKAKLVVFIDGCFWHLCPQHGHIPKNNVQYWEEKLNRNRDKDNADTKLLTENGWHVLRIWEHVPIEEAVDIIARNLKYLAESNNVPKIISQNI